MIDHTFEVNSKIIKNQRIGTLIISFITFLCIVYTIVQIPYFTASKSFSFIISSICVFFFGLLTWLSIIRLKKLPFFSVKVNDEGIWAAHLNKNEALVKWSEIREVEESVLSQRWVLLNNFGNNLLNINCAQLNDYEQLRGILIEKSNLDITLPLKFIKRYISFLITLLVLDNSLIIIGTFILHGKVLVVSGVSLALTVLILYLFFKDGWRIDLLSGLIKIYYPFKSLYIKPGEIKSVSILDIESRNVKFPEIQILLINNPKIIKLSRFNVSSIFLLKAIKDNGSVLRRSQF